MGYDRFEVTETNPAFGFAKVRAKSGGQVYHCELYPDGEGGGGKLRLQVGDEVDGLRRGQSVTRISWVKQVPPPLALLTQAASLLQALRAHGVEVAESAEELASRQWRGKQDAAQSLLREHLFHLFDDEVPPFEDPTLPERLQQAMARHVPEVSVMPVPGRPAFSVSGVEVPVHAQSRDPMEFFRPLLEHLNGLLGKKDAPVRWLPVEENYVLAAPELLLALGEKGAVAGAPVASA